MPPLATCGWDEGGRIKDARGHRQVAGACRQGMDIDLELAIALTNANINSGRIKLCSIIGETNVGEQAVFAHSLRKNENYMDFLASHPTHVHGQTPPSALCAINKKNSWILVAPPGSTRESTRFPSPPRVESPSRVVWSTPLEIEAGPGYSVETGKPSSYRPNDRVSAQRSQSRLAMLNTHEHFGQTPPGASPPQCSQVAPPTGHDTNGAVVRGARLLCTKPIGRMRADLYMRLGMCAHTQMSLSNKVHSESVLRCAANKGEEKAADEKMPEEWSPVQRENEVDEHNCCIEGRERSMSFSSVSSSLLSSSSTVISYPCSPATRCTPGPLPDFNAYEEG